MPSQYNSQDDLTFRIPAATEGAVTLYVANGQRVLEIVGYSWFYESAEANTDNTIDWTCEYTVDGTTFVEIKNNGNANGLLNTAAVLVAAVNKADAASGGAAAITALIDVLVPANAIVRFVGTTAGTGTIPAIQFTLFGPVSGQ